MIRPPLPSSTVPWPPRLAWARRPARTYAAATRGAGLGTAHSPQDRDPCARHRGEPAGHRARTRPQPGRGPGHSRKHARPRPPSWVPPRAGQQARAPRSAPSEREGRRIMGHVTSPEKMHRGAIASLDNYSLDWNPPFGRIRPPLPSSTVPHPSATSAPGRAPAGQRARMWPRPGERAWARHTARKAATPAPGTGVRPRAIARVRFCGPGRGPGHASQRARPRPPSRAPPRAGQHARAPRSAPPEREGRRIMGHVTSPEKMHRGAIHQIITAWIGIPRSGGFVLPSGPQPCRASPRHPRRARARRPARPRARACARRIALLKTWGEEASLLPSQYVSSPPKTGGKEGLCFCRCALYQNILYGATRGSAPVLWYGRPPASGQRVMAIADHVPLTEAGVRPAACWGL